MLVLKLANIWKLFYSVDSIWIQFKPTTLKSFKLSCIFRKASHRTFKIKEEDSQDRLVLYLLSNLQPLEDKVCALTQCYNRCLSGLILTEAELYQDDFFDFFFLRPRNQGLSFGHVGLQSPGIGLQI